MAHSTIPQTAIDELEKTKGVMESATLFINGSAARQQAAIDKALEKGATADELAPVQAELDATIAKREELAAAIAANP